MILFPHALSLGVGLLVLWLLYSEESTDIGNCVHLAFGSYSLWAKQKPGKRHELENCSWNLNGKKFTFFSIMDILAILKIRSRVSKISSQISATPGKAGHTYIHLIKHSAIQLLISHSQTCLSFWEEESELTHCDTLYVCVYFVVPGPETEAYTCSSSELLSICGLGLALN